MNMKVCKSCFYMELRSDTLQLLFKSNYFLNYGCDTYVYCKPYIKRKSIKFQYDLTDSITSGVRIMTFLIEQKVVTFKK